MVVVLSFLYEVALTEVYTWLVTVSTGSSEAKYCERKEVVFITEGVDLGQLQKEVEIRFGLGQRVDILEVKSLGPLGNRKT